MQITFLNPKGLIPSEVIGVSDMRARLPKAWFGYTNFNMRNPAQKGQDREIDVALITPDRIILVDLKSQGGKIESRTGRWSADGRDMGPSAAHKIRENAKVMASLIRQQVREIPGNPPPIESAVVFSNPRADLSGLSIEEKERTFKLDDFLRIADPKAFQAAYPSASSFNGPLSLTVGQPMKGLEKLFTNGRIILARKASYHGFVSDGTAEFSHPLFREFSAYDQSDPNYTAMLRLWDFAADPDAFALEEDRRNAASRERKVLGYLSTNDPDLYNNFVLRSRAHDEEYTLNYYEIFDRHKDLSRLSRYAGQVANLDMDRRLELAKLFLDRVAGLHRMRVAHRDLGRHSTWIDERRSKVALSGLGAAHFPDVDTMGALRATMLAGRTKVPEDAKAGKPGSPFQQDVFLAAATVWTILTGDVLHSEQDVPMWPPDSLDHEDLPQEIVPWFEKCLAMDAADRMTDGVEAAEEFERALSRNERINLDRQLMRHRRELDPMVEFPAVDWVKKSPYRVFRSRGEDGTDLFVKSWPSRFIGDVRKSTAHLLDFFSRVERLQSLAPAWSPAIEFACLTMDGLLLVQRWSDGDALETGVAAGWSATQLGSFLLELVTAVEELHLQGLAHGDLKPANILVKADTDNPSVPLLLDLFDYSPERDGERSTMAYSPPAGASEPVNRDCYAVAAISIEMAKAWSEAHLGRVWARAIESAAGECGEGEQPWTTLIPLRKLLQEGPREGADASRLELAIPIGWQQEIGPVLSDNGKFHLLLKPAQQQLEICGFDRKITVDLAPDRKPTAAKVRDLSARSATWTSWNSSLSFEGDIRLVSRQANFEGFDALWALVDAGKPESASSPQRPGTDVPEPAGAVSTPTKKATLPFPVVRFWEETIGVEEAQKPEIKLSATPRETGEPGRIVLSVVDPVDWDAFDIDSGKTVKLTRDGEVVGVVDIDRSHGNLVAVKNAREFRRFSVGDCLRIHSGQDLSSFQRRSRATQRILRGRSQIPDLIRYFDPNAKVEPLHMAAPVPQDDLDKYGLNEDQQEAFQHLWQNGPLGLLQGPPGTGKTKFIAAFAHWALNGGRLNNVLILSQSHEAVNNASERVLSVFEELGGDIELLRVGPYEKISAPLRKYHSAALQDRYRELFRADVKARLEIVGRRLGLSDRYVREAHEVEATLGALVRQMDYAERDIDEGAGDGLVQAAERRLAGLHRAFNGMLPSGEEAGGSPRDILEEIREGTAGRFGVHDLDARERFLGLEELSLSWLGALSNRNRNLEEFLARSRNLVSGTCVGIGRHGLRIDKGAFDLVIIDEAARCMPSELAVGMQSAKRVLLVGDHRQLPPLFGHEFLQGLTERLPGFARTDLRKSDFERAFASSYGTSVARTLRLQYRMAPEIGTLVSDNFYPGEGLKTARPEPHSIYATLQAPLDAQTGWLDTGRQASDSEARTSYVNRREATVIIEVLRGLAANAEFLGGAPEALKLKPGEPLVGVICMYAQQKLLIEELLMTSDMTPDFRELVSIDTVDAYQGKECPIVILSMVRNNRESAMGHVKSRNRLNVALSRAMDRLLIVGSAEMFGTTRSPVAPIVASLKAMGRVRTIKALGLKA